MKTKAQEIAQATIKLCASVSGHVPNDDIIRKISAIGNSGKSPQNNERDLQRLIKKHGLSLDIPIETCQVEMYDPKSQRTSIRNLPIIFPDTFASAIFAESEALFKKLFIGDIDAETYLQAGVYLVYLVKLNFT